LRLTFSATAATLLAVAAPAASQPAPSDDVLGTLTVPPGASTRALPKVAVVTAPDPDADTAALRALVARDLDLSGELDVLADAPSGKGPRPGPKPRAGELDLRAFQARGAEAVVRVRAAREGGAVVLELEGFLVRGALAAEGAKPAPAWRPRPAPKPSFARAVRAPAADLRPEGHRLADHVLGAMTGHAGSFASHLAFAGEGGGARRVFVVDADGEGLAPASPPDALAIAVGFGKAGELHYVASVERAEYQVFAAGAEPVPLPVAGPVYGLAFAPDKSAVAVTVGVKDTIRLFVGPDLESVAPRYEVDLAMQPAFGPGGRVAFVGQGRMGRRVFVDGKPITPDAMMASSPTFCDHPDGVKVLFAAGAGKATDLVVTGERGGGFVRLTRGLGSNGVPACSPDGRLVAFFSTRTSGEGPGLYVMRVGGGPAHRIAKHGGYALAWEPLPPSRATPIPR
jgi:TolB protein